MATSPASGDPDDATSAIPDRPDEANPAAPDKPDDATPGARDRPGDIPSTAPDMAGDAEPTDRDDAAPVAPLSTSPGATAAAAADPLPPPATAPNAAATATAGPVPPSAISPDPAAAAPPGVDAARDIGGEWRHARDPQTVARDAGYAVAALARDTVELVRGSWARGRERAPADLTELRQRVERGFDRKAEAGRQVADQVRHSDAYERLEEQGRRMRQQSDKLRSRLQRRAGG